MLHVVKRKGHKEKFDERKVYASCYEACLSAHLEKKHAENICEQVSRNVKKWMKTKKEVSSSEISRKVTSFIKKHSKDAAFMYETHRDVS